MGTTCRLAVWVSVAAALLFCASSQALARDWKLGVEVMDAGGGALIMAVFNGSPADQMGLMPGMVIVSIDGYLIDDVYTMHNYIMQPGRRAVTLIYSDGSQFIQQDAWFSVVTYHKYGKAVEDLHLRKSMKKVVPDPRHRH